MIMGQQHKNNRSKDRKEQWTSAEPPIKLVLFSKIEAFQTSFFLTEQICSSQICNEEKMSIYSNF